MPFPTLTELAKTPGEIDTKEFGSKTWGVVELMRIREEFDSCISYNVPDAFAIPFGASLENIEQAWNSLTKNDEDLTGYLVRSSGDDELPGEHESLPVTNDPQDSKKSFERFRAAAERVTNNPQKPALVQRMVGGVRHVEEDEDPSSYLGVDITGFVARSHDHFNPTMGVITACFGLPTKLVKQDPGEICVFPIERDVAGVRHPFNTGNDYQIASQNYYQEDIEVFDASLGLVVNRQLNDFFAIHSRHEMFNNFVPVPLGFKTGGRNIAKILSKLANRYQTAVELEGAFDFPDVSHNLWRHAQQRLNLFQLSRQSLLPAYELLSVEKERTLYRTEYGAIGGMLFEGDVVFIDPYERSSVPALLEQLLAGRDPARTLVVTPSFLDEIPDRGFQTYAVMNSYESFQTENHLPVRGGSTSHVIGRASVEVFRRSTKGHVVCGVFDENIWNACAKLKDVPGFSDLRQPDMRANAWQLSNVSVQAGTGCFQIYR